MVSDIRTEWVAIFEAGLVVTCLHWIVLFRA